GFMHDPYAEIITLEFLVTSITHIDQIADHLCRLCRAVITGGHNGRAGEPLGQFHFGNTLGTMPRNHMTDLMSKYTSQLIFIFQPAEQRCSNKYLPSGKCKRIDSLRICQQMKIVLIRCL